jgi:hypothetical protein
VVGDRVADRLGQHRPRRLTVDVGPVDPPEGRLRILLDVQLRLPGQLLIGELGARYMAMSILPKLAAEGDGSGQGRKIRPAPPPGSGRLAGVG